MKTLPNDLLLLIELTSDELALITGGNPNALGNQAGASTRIGVASGGAGSPGGGGGSGGGGGGGGHPSAGGLQPLL